jgi:beta-glucuronidase
MATMTQITAFSFLSYVRYRPANPAAPSWGRRYPGPTGQNAGPVRVGTYELIQIRRDSYVRPRLLGPTRSRALVAAALALFAAGVASAPALAYSAQPPTKGALYRDGQTGRYLLGGAWLYRPDPADVGVAQGWWRDVAASVGWSAVTVPNADNAGDYSTPSMEGSVGWYRRDFTAPAGAFARYVPQAARRWIVRFEAVNYRATIWLNGQVIGTHVGAELPFELDLRGVRSGTNRLIVRVDNRKSSSDLPPGPTGGWWNYGGLLGEVYLRAVQRADIAQVQVRPLLGCAGCATTVQEQVIVRNPTDAPQFVRLRGAYGSVRLDFGSATIAPHATWSTEAFARVAHPHLWSLEDPALYRAALTLSDARGRPLGGYITYDGIRTIRVSTDGRLTLNGRVLSLRGVEVRQQDLELGAALDPAHLARLFGWVKALGATVIRSDPLNPELEELADREGVLIWSDIPVVADVLDQPSWIARAQALVRSNVISNDNHPSVAIWGIGNELPTPATDAESTYIAATTAMVHAADPTRPVGMAIRDWPGVPCQPAYAPLDLIGLNEYFGWYDAGLGATSDRDELGPFLDSLRSCYPHQALFVSEFGFESDRGGPVEEHGTYQFQADAVAYHLSVFATKAWLSGAIYSLLQDTPASPGFAGGNPLPDPPFDHKGLLDLQGNPKPAWSVVASSYHATTQIAPAPAGR